MKKFHISLFLSLLLLALCLVSCDELFEESTSDPGVETVTDIYVSLETIPEKSTDSVAEETPVEMTEGPAEDPTVEVTEEPTVGSTEEPTEDATEGSTEEPTEEMTEEETEAPIPCTHEYPQGTVDQLIAEGLDMEQLIFERGPDIELQYTFIVNKRVLRHGEQLEVTIWNLISACDFVDLQKHYETFQEWGASPLMLFTPNGEVIYIDYTYTVLGPHFALTIPDDLEPGTYHLVMDLLSEHCIDECCIVIY